MGQYTDGDGINSHGSAKLCDQPSSFAKAIPFGNLVCIGSHTLFQLLALICTKHSVAINTKAKELSYRTHSLKPFRSTSTRKVDLSFL